MDITLDNEITLLSTKSGGGTLFETSLINSSTVEQIFTCEEVALERGLSLGFSFVATLFLCYVIIALLVYLHKKKLLVECGKGWIRVAIYNSCCKTKKVVAGLKKVVAGLCENTPFVVKKPPQASETI